MTPSENRIQTRNDLAWSIAVGGIGVIVFAAALAFAWYFSATLFLIFAGVLLGVTLTAMSNQLHRIIGGPHALRLVIVCLVMAALFAGIVTLGGSTIAQQATALSGTIKTQIVNLKEFLERHGVDTSYLDLNNANTPSSSTTTPSTPRSLPSNLPSAGAIASGGGAIVSQTLKLILGTVGAVVIARWSWTLMRDTAAILLDCTDPHVAEEVRELVEAPGDAKITDLHVWRVGPEAHAAIVEVTGAASTASIRKRLGPVHEIAHLTVALR